MTDLALSLHGRPRIHSTIFHFSERALMRRRPRTCRMSRPFITELGRCCLSFPAALLTCKWHTPYVLSVERQGNFAMHQPQLLTGPLKLDTGISFFMWEGLGSLPKKGLLPLNQFEWCSTADEMAYLLAAAVSAALENWLLKLRGVQHVSKALNIAANNDCTKGKWSFNVGTARNT